ncbi:MAG: hypothetical protein ABIR96_05010 [Bdellovibrionota bacterium]
MHRGHTVTIVLPGELKESFVELRGWSLEALIKAEDRLQLPLEEDVEIYFDTVPLLHNGLTTAVPRNRISVNVEAPDLNSSVGVSRFYLLETLVHEWGHMLSIGRHHGIFRGFSWILGHASRPNGAWPRWIHEGLAVWTEESVGGRPLSGSIDLDLRRYAEFTRRSGKDALNNSLLDGQWDLANFRPGQVPYTFGYLIIDELSKKKDFTIGRFVEASSYDLGISFRKTFENLGVDLDGTFEDLRKKWATTPVDTTTSPATLVSAQTDIRGLQSNAGYVSWVESSDDNPTQLVAESSSKKVRRNWPFKLLTVAHATPLEISSTRENWAVLVENVPELISNDAYSPAAPARRRLVIFDATDSELHCTFDLGDRLREVNITPRHILWVESTSDEKPELYEAEWNQSCEISGKTLLLQAKKFERLSAPAMLADGVVITHNVSSLSSFVERIEDIDGKVLEVDGVARPLTQFNAGAGGNGVIFERSPHYWGPMIVKLGKSALEAYKVPLRTGAYEAVVDPEGKNLYYIEKLWDGDEVRRLSVTDPSLKKELVLKWKSPAFGAPSSEDSAELKPTLDKTETLQDHGPIDDIWPHFWIPSLLASEGSWVVAGQTFYSDLTKTWSGASLLGYNTGTKKPFGSTSLSWIPSTTTSWPQFDMQLRYDPRDVSYFGVQGQTVQERASADLDATFVYGLAHRFRGTLTLGYSFRYSGELGDFEGEVTHNPFLRLSLKSRYATNPYLTLSRLSESPAFFYFEQKARWFKAPELQTNIYGLLKATSRTRILLALEGAHTELRNFPNSFYVWGGSPLPGANFEGNYLNRGFPLQAFVAERLVRFSSEWIWGLWEPRASLSWNRLRVQNVDLRLVGESITWDSMFGDTYHLGKQFSSSLGTEVDILGSGLHYISYKLSVGAFRGFGDFAQTRYTAQLRVGLDL